MPEIDLQGLPLWVHVIVAALAAAGVWRGGSRLAAHGDGIAERTGWSEALVGVLLLAAMTELPELVTTVAAAAREDAPMAANNLFGGIALQTAILLVADLSLRRGPLTFFAPSPELILQGLLVILLLALTLACIVIGERVTVFGIGGWSALLFAAYAAGTWLLRRHGEGDAWQPVEVPGSPRDERGDGEPGSRRGSDRPLSALVGGFLGAGALVLVSGTAVVYSAEVIAERTGLGSSFVGATLVAGTTSLPELSTTLGAVRLGAYKMAVANIFGSNAIMIALLLPVDVALRGGPLLDAVDSSARFSAAAGIAVTAAYLIGLVERRDRAFLGLGLDSWIVLVLYAATLAGLYSLRQ